MRWRGLMVLRPSWSTFTENQSSRILGASTPSWLKYKSSSSAGILPTLGLWPGSTPTARRCVIAATACWDLIRFKAIRQWAHPVLDVYTLEKVGHQLSSLRGILRTSTGTKQLMQGAVVSPIICLKHIRVSSGRKGSGG